MCSSNLPAVPGTLSGVSVPQRSSTARRVRLNAAQSRSRPLFGSGIATCTEPLRTEPTRTLRWKCAIKEYTPGGLTSFQVGGGAHILEVVHVDDVDDGGHHPGLVLCGAKQEERVEDMREREQRELSDRPGSHIPVPRVSQTC